MKSKNLFYLIVAAVAIMAVFFLSNFISFIKQDRTESGFLSAYDVQGMAIVNSNQPYTLNFEQQNAVIAAINAAVPVGSQQIDTKEKKPEFEKIIVYLFQNKPIEIIPLAYLNNNLVFSLSTDPGRQLKETTDGKLKNILLDSFDH